MVEILSSTLNLLNEQNTPDAGEIFSAGASDNLQGIGCNVADV